MSQPDVVAARTRAFVEEHVLPVEDEFDGDVEAAGGDRLRVELQRRARELGVFAPHVSVELGGLGLGMADRAPVFEAAGRALFGPMAVNIDAPDEGNVHLLEHVATARAAGAVPAPAGRRATQRSAFAMTEPAPGAGLGPDRAAHRAPRRSTAAGWSTGRRSSSPAPTAPASSSSWRAPAGARRRAVAPPCSSCRPTAPGIKVGGTCGTLDRSMLGGHCEVRFDRRLRARRRRARRGRRGVPLRAGPARAGPDDPRDALARRGAARPRRRPSARERAPGLRRGRWPTSAWSSR